MAELQVTVQPTVFVGLGSNLGDSETLMRQALRRLEPLSAQPLLCSSLWRTSPVDCPPGSPAFINAVAGLEPRAGDHPESMLEALQQIERAFGRPDNRSLNAARLLDLDLIAWGDRAVRNARLILPHPRAHLRRFVLEPLAELAPDLKLPGQTRTVRELLADLHSNEHVVRI